MVDRNLSLNAPRIYSDAVIQVANFLEREQPDRRPSQVRGRDIGAFVCPGQSSHSRGSHSTFG